MGLLCSPRLNSGPRQPLCLQCRAASFGAVAVIALCPRLLKSGVFLGGGCSVRKPQPAACLSVAVSLDS